MKRCALALLGAVPGCIFAGVPGTRVPGDGDRFSLRNVFYIGGGGHVTGYQEYPGRNSFLGTR
eukprot:2318171-Rhodomonas_salina.1